MPPFAVAPTSFRFPGLAALAGRAPLGGQREVVLAVYLVARLTQDTLPDRGLSDATRAERAAAAKAWLSGVALPAPVRSALAKAVEASSGPPDEAGQAVRDVASITTSYLDSSSRIELDQLAGALTGRGLQKRT
jgi:hypothetical protein